jgi:multiple sugar transport system permease protein
MQQEAARARRAPMTPRISGRRIAGKVVPRIILALMCLFYFAPFYWMLITSLKDNTQLGGFPPSFWPHPFVWRNYVDAVNYIPFLRFFVNSLILTAGDRKSVV